MLLRWPGDLRGKGREEGEGRGRREGLASLQGSAVAVEAQARKCAPRLTRQVRAAAGDALGLICARLGRPLHQLLLHSADTRLVLEYVGRWGGGGGGVKVG